MKLDACKQFLHQFLLFLFNPVISPSVFPLTPSRFRFIGNSFAWYLGFLSFFLFSDLFSALGGLNYITTLDKQRLAPLLWSLTTRHPSKISRCILFSNWPPALLDQADWHPSGRGSGRSAPIASQTVPHRSWFLWCFSCSDKLDIVIDLAHSFSFPRTT